MAEEAETDVERSSATEQRGSGERRRYNRRTAASDMSPPYYEVFERIANALESIGDVLAGRRPDLQPPAPRRAGRDESGPL